DGVLCVGVGIADATWQVGAGAGQYAGDTDGSAVTGGDIDPHAHAVKSKNSYGVQSRLTMRALVVRGSNGRKIVLLKSDNYLAQNHLIRRAGQLLAAAGSSITADDILHSATHNHNSPYYSTPSAGVWVFQDVMDLRAFEYQARAIRDAILAGEKNLAAARMGATEVAHHLFKSNIVRPATADDGTPAGYPLDFGDNEIAVMRFDSVATGKPIAAWVNHGEHPESLDGYQLISADYLGALERFVQADVGAPLVFSQGDVGSSEGPYGGDRNVYTLPDGTLRAWAHMGFAQAERGARLLADSIKEGWDAIGAGQGTVPFSTDVPVELLTYWAPGPVSHPYPGVSACRSQPTVDGQLGVPNAADCNRDAPGAPLPPVFENMKAEGLPVPENYDLPAFGTIEENNRLELQAARLGDVLLASCSCEAQVDLILNLESRANNKVGDTWDGFPWDQYCDDRGNGTHACAEPRRDNLSDRSLIVSDAEFEHMRAEIHNDARGWDDPAYAPYANGEAADPAAIKGNFTKEELDGATGFPLVVGLGHTGDYNGYTVSYREYMNRESYRKALTSYGAHTADYMVTRLVRMAKALKTGTPFVPTDALGPLAAVDEARQAATSQALGNAVGVAYDAWVAALPEDAGSAEALRQPTPITRFDAATFEWRGGSNAIDNPMVSVERLAGGRWVPFAGQSGEVQTAVAFPQGIAGVANTYAGQQEWLWTASFEAFDSAPARLGQTPNGTYRFVVDGAIRKGGVNKPYHLESDGFAVMPWDGITISDIAVAGGDVSFVVDPITYPRTYESRLPFVGDTGPNSFCKTCSFRPWAATGAAASATVEVLNPAQHSVRSVKAKLVFGRWVANTNLGPAQHARIATGAVRDTWGEINAVSYAIGADGSVVAQAAAGPHLTGAASAKAGAAAVPTSPASSSRPLLAAAIAALLAIAGGGLVARRLTRTTSP
ncbi:MAG: neutral/alkaline non-lysosomal ceramidase N-terminal domain-containing protein, partial [Acidimicrobiales bacterium]